ncbi:MAG: ATP-binding protein [Bryobacteraceae bacterium]|jgi:signal transduction histidine kinase
MTLRARLLALTLSMVAIVAVTLTALNLNSLAVVSLDVALSSSEMAGRQVQSFILRRLSEDAARAPAPANTAEAERRWNQDVAHDADIAALLEQVMAQSRSIIEVDVAGQDGIILASSSPPQRGTPMSAREDLRALRDAGPVGRMTAILTSHYDYETRVPLGIAGQTAALFTIQILVSPVLLRAAVVPEVRNIAIASGLALALACVFAYWLASLALRPLTRVGHLIDDVASGKALGEEANRRDDARELAIIHSKLSVLGERYRDAREDASQLRANLEGVLEKLDARTRRHFEDQIALARRLAAINSLTSRVAHEIKNPLNSIALRLELLRSRSAEDSPDSQLEMAILAEEVTRLDRVVRTFLDFSRPVELRLEDVNVGELAAEILRVLEPEAERNGVAVSLAQPPDAVLVKADSGLLRQALVNIAVNAIEAMQGGGSLRVEIERSGEICSIRIADTGPGIPQEQRDKIFQLYFTTKPQGTGIGLAMTFRAVQLHGGTIEVEAEGGQGATFRVTLPLAGVDKTA